MVLHRICIRKILFCKKGKFAIADAGFTIIEFLVVIALISAVAGLGLVMSINSFGGFSFNNDYDIAVASLQHARSLAVNNVCAGPDCVDGKPHGVHFEPGWHKVVIFQGSSYFLRDETADEIVNFESQTTTVAAATDVIFRQISGDAVSPATVEMTDGVSQRNRKIGIDSGGQIDY